MFKYFLIFIHSFDLFLLKEALLEVNYTKDQIKFWDMVDIEVRSNFQEDLIIMEDPMQMKDIAKYILDR